MDMTLQTDAHFKMNLQNSNDTRSVVHMHVSNRSGLQGRSACAT